MRPSNARGGGDVIKMKKAQGAIATKRAVAHNAWNEDDTQKRYSISEACISVRDSSLFRWHFHFPALSLFFFYFSFFYVFVLRMFSIFF